MAQETILVVDDSPTELRIMAGSLREQGYRIVTAADGDEALAQVARERPRLIVLDVVMPRKNGFQVCRQLKTSPETRDIKIVLVTSKATGKKG
jgi:twitching motility two-component system response regulator PilH